MPGRPIGPRAAPAVLAAALVAACSNPPATLGPPDGAAGSTDAAPTADAPTCTGGCAELMLAHTFGGLGNDPGQFFEPSSVELDSTGIVIVAGHENRVQRFMPDGTLLDIFGTAGPGDGQFNHPHGLAVDRNRGDIIYVGDQENHRLQVFTQSGQFIRQWGDAGFEHIHDVGIDPVTGDVFVGDYELHTLRKFSPTGDLIANYGGAGTGPGQFNGVWGVSTDSQSRVYVTDTFNRRVQVFDSSGVFLAQWNDAGGTPFQKPTGVFVDSQDVVHICDSLAETVSRFATDGTLIEQWDLRAIIGKRTEPEDIVISADGADIYIAEVFEHEVHHLVRANP